MKQVMRPLTTAVGRSLPLQFESAARHCTEAPSYRTLQCDSKIVASVRTGGKLFFFVLLNSFDLVIISTLPSKATNNAPVSLDSTSQVLTRKRAPRAVLRDRTARLAATIGEEGGKTRLATGLFPSRSPLRAPLGPARRRPLNSHALAPRRRRIASSRYWATLGNRWKAQMSAICKATAEWCSCHLRLKYLLSGE